jgi:hypothetical protein
MNLAGVHESMALRDKTLVFEDRTHAGALLADLLAPYLLQGGLVLGILDRCQ